MNKRGDRWQLLFEGLVPKDLAYPEANEDRLRYCTERGIYALSDGASESYNSQLWADVLVHHAISMTPQSRFTGWLKGAIAAYTERSCSANLSWSQEAAYARGSFASLLVVSLLEEHLEVLAIGDTVAILVENGKAVRSFSYQQSEEFRQRPHLLSTLRSRNFSPYFQRLLRCLIRHNKGQDTECVARWQYPTSEGSFLVCVTDALGEWLLRSDERATERLHAILAVRTEQDLVSLVEKARADDGMRRDDSTLLLIGEPDGASLA